MSRKLVIVHHVRNWYARFERPISSISLVGGFVFDALTLKRVDTLWENVWVIGHIVIIGICIILVHAIKNHEGDEGNPAKVHFWLVNILQFFFGGILSTYLVFYFRSGDISVSWPFILILAIAFWANEAFKRHFVRLGFQVSLFYLSLFSFTIFSLPVLVHKIGPRVFFLSGLISLLIMWGFLWILHKVAHKEFEQGRRIITFSVLGIFLGINFLYMTNLIPPIPLSLKDAGAYHSVIRDSKGNYVVGFENEGWKKYLSLYRTVHIAPVDPVYAYSAVFSPSSLDTTVIHEWQYYDENKGIWTHISRQELPVIGGREDGFRTFSTNSNLSAGKWRVNVETEGGQVIGRIRFNVVYTDKEPTLVFKTNT